MLILVVFIAGLVALRLAGGDMRQLNHLRLRWYGVAIAAVITQIVILIVFPEGWRDGHLLANLATYAAIGVFLWVNRRIPWLWVVALGAASNTAAIAFNGGVMPASRTALAITHLKPRPGFANSAVVAHPRLGFLGDVIPTPPWLPFHNVASVGDVLIVVGALLLVARQVLPPPADRPWRVTRGRHSGANQRRRPA